MNKENVISLINNIDSNDKDTWEYIYLFLSYVIGNKAVNEVVDEDLIAV